MDLRVEKLVLGFVCINIILPQSKTVTQGELLRALKPPPGSGTSGVDGVKKISPQFCVLGKRWDSLLQTLPTKEIKAKH